MTSVWRFVSVDVLEKVFADESPRPTATPDRSVFVGETFSTQVAFRPPAGARKIDDVVRFAVDVPGGVDVTVSSVDLVPCELAAFPEHDDGYLRDMPGLYPDLLRPAPDGLVAPIVGGWRAAWIDITACDPSVVGDISIKVRASHVLTDEVLYTDEFSLRVLGASLPALDMVNTHWMYADCLAEFYDDDVYSAGHWQAIDSFIASAARMSVNSVLMPAWTPPIDTEVGARRRNVQLVDIYVDGERTTFNFDRVKRWLEICARHGMTHIELPHLFTQWGASAAPALYATVDGEQRQLFGWDTPATSPAYAQFLEQLIPSLRSTLAEHWNPGKIIYHVSDEPDLEHYEAYSAAQDVVARLLDGCFVADALSDVRYYNDGIVKSPVIATDHFEAFADAGIERPWVYFCQTQHRDVANRFVAMPSSRLRILGGQLFKADAGGFLHWGFNFYNSAKSLRAINPFTDASGGGTLPAGDPFVVYPGDKREPWPSIRYRVSTQAMNDHRALQLLRDLTSREHALSALDPTNTLTFRSYSHDAAEVNAARARVNHEVHHAIRSKG